MNNNGNNKPVSEFSLGHVKASVWKNKNDKFSSYSVSTTKAYKAKDSDEWKFGSSFERDDLPLLSKVLDRAHSYIFDAEKADRKS